MSTCNHVDLKTHSIWTKYCESHRTLLWMWLILHIYEIQFRLVKDNRKMSTCNHVDLETLRFLPIMPKNLPKTGQCTQELWPYRFSQHEIFVRGGRWVLHSQVIRQAKPNGSKPYYGSLHSLPTWYSDAGQHATIKPLAPTDAAWYGHLEA
jgi:hypothetical protein